MALPPSIELLLRQGARNVGRINARSSAIGNALQPYAGQVQSRYAGFQANEQALGGAVSNSQTQLGQQLGGSITSALQGIQAPGAAVSQYGGGTATTGAQAGQAIGGLSSAELGRLRGEGSAEAIYAAALPRLAALAGDAERRGYLSELAQEASDLALRESQSQYERQLDERKLRYQMAQDAYARRRQAKIDRYKVKQDAIARKNQAKRDKFAHDLAVKAGLLDERKEDRYRAQAIETTRHHAATEGISWSNLTERQRHDRVNEQIARDRERRQRAKAAGTSKGADVYKDIVSSAKDIAKPTENPKTGQVTRLPRAQAKRRLRAEFPGATPQQIDRALVAAGY